MQIKHKSINKTHRNCCECCLRAFDSLCIVCEYDFKFEAYNVIKNKCEYSMWWMPQRWENRERIVRKWTDFGILQNYYALNRSFEYPIVIIYLHFITWIHFSLPRKIPKTVSGWLFVAVL